MQRFLVLLRNQDCFDAISRSFFCNIQLYLENDQIKVSKDLINVPLSITDYETLVSAIIDKLTKLKKDIKNTVEYSDDILAKKMLEYIRQHYREDISLEDLANHVGFHPNYLSRAFRKRIGQSYLECIHKERLKEAKKMLLETNYTIEYIAEEMGYNSSSQFARVFRKYEGVSPSVYRISTERG